MSFISIDNRPKNALTSTIQPFIRKARQKHPSWFCFGDVRQWHHRLTNQFQFIYDDIAWWTPKLSFDASDKIRSSDILLREFPENEISATLNAKITHETLLANFIVRTVMNDKAVKCVSALFFKNLHRHYVPTLIISPKIQILKYLINLHYRSELHLFPQRCRFESIEKS